MDRGGTVSLRTRLLLIFGGIVVITVLLVSLGVSVGSRKAFQQVDEQRTAAIIGQFRREFEQQGQALQLRTAAIARAQQIHTMVLNLSRPSGDPAPYLNLAPTLAGEQQLDFLEILNQDGAIISSAQWPARFGVREPWINSVADWNHQPAFLQYEETPQRSELALLSVRQIAETDRKFYLVAGRRVDSAFLHGLSLPEGARLLLWSQPPDTNGELYDASGTVAPTAEIASIVSQSRSSSSEITKTISLGKEAYVAHTIPLSGLDAQQPAAILIVASSRREVTQLQSSIRNVALVVALIGIALSVIASGWSAARISRPIENLSEAAQDVAAGIWERKVEADPESKDEVSQLIASFNRMTDELLRQRDRAVQAERVAAWRELARRLAHELKNPLFPLQITVENLVRARRQNSPEFDEIFAESTRTLLAELTNLNKIIGRFSDFSRMPAPHLQTVDLNSLVDEVMRLFSAQLNSASNSIRVEIAHAAAGASISGDPDLLRRSFENLVLNAIDVMPNGGTLRIETSAARDTVALDISDTGIGLTPEECARLFTPYYTTKRHGTGLGLAIVQSVISDHGARISVSSHKGQGTTFHIEFPRAGSAQPLSAVPASRG
jgi:signal transduction histidine kinase